jgi:hypothetical protein
MAEPLRPHHRSARERPMHKRPKPSPDSKARAAAIHAEIDRLTTGKASEKPADEKPADEKPADEKPADGKKAPLSPRDYIQQYMAEHDKKPDK